MNTATRYTCSARPSVHCARGNGKPRRTHCAYCGSVLRVETGQYGTFIWREDGRYPVEQAVRLFASEAAAYRAAGDEYVVRFIPIR